MDNKIKGDHLIPISRLGMCEVCGTNQAKYTCPECEVKSCCLTCVKIHKKELNCMGVRNRVKFKRLSEFTNMDLHSDYMLLEEATRHVDSIKKKGFFCKNRKSEERIFKIQKACLKRGIGIKLEFLPSKFNKHIENQTYLDWKKDIISWTLKWILVEQNTTVLDKRVDENKQLGEILNQHIPDLKDIKILLKAEKVSGKKFFLANPSESITENLKGKTIIEFPIFYVIPENKLGEYQIVHLAPKNKMSKNLLMNEDYESDENEK